jgi:hypothetical protein
MKAPSKHAKLLLRIAISALSFVLLTGIPYYFSAIASSQIGFENAEPIPEPAGEGVFPIANRNVTVTIGNSDAGFTSDISLVSPKLINIGTNKQPGTVVSLGTFDPGVELIFQISVRDTGQIFQTGPATRNKVDNIVHANLVQIEDGTIDVQFEDILKGDGLFDSDYNDVTFTVSGVTINKQQQQELQAAIDVKPTSCPNPINAQKGTVPVAILGTPGFDVTKVDIASVRLEGVAPIRSEFEDVATPFVGSLIDRESCTTLGPDGQVDLTLKFDAPTLFKALGDKVNRTAVVVTLTGKLRDKEGTSFSAKDVVWPLR